MKMLQIIVPLLLCFLSCEQATFVSPAAYACESPAREAHPQAEVFRSLLTEVLPFTTGVQVAVTDRNGARWSGAKGFADLANDVPLEPCHRLMIASISKTVTAALILQLHEEGMLDLDDLLSAWLPDELIGELANAREVTLRQLLHHTSGIPDYLTTEQYLRSLNEPFLRESQRAKLRYAYGLPAEGTPGAEFNYSNTNFVLLGLVVEEARNRPLWEVVAARMAGPLGQIGRAHV